jgi:hypothetical protein
LSIQNTVVAAASVDLAQSLENNFSLLKIEFDSDMFDFGAARKIREYQRRNKTKKETDERQQVYKVSANLKKSVENDQRFVTHERERLNKLEKKHKISYEQERERVEQLQLYEILKTNKLRDQLHNVKQQHDVIADKLESLQNGISTGEIFSNYERFIKQELWT